MDEGEIESELADLGLEPGRHVSGVERERTAAVLKEIYAQTRSIRAVASRCNRSYGFVLRLLRDYDVPIGPHGGWRRARKAPRA